MRLEELAGLARDNVAAPDDEVGELPRLERAPLLLLEARVGGLDREEAERLLARQSLARQEASLGQTVRVLAGDGGVDPEERVLGLDREVAPEGDADARSQELSPRVGRLHAVGADARLRPAHVARRVGGLHRMR